MRLFLQTILLASTISIVSGSSDVSNIYFKHNFMNTYLISYDLGSPEGSNDYRKVISYIESFVSWAKPLKSQYFVTSSKSAGDIRSELRAITDSNDKILVIDVGGDGWATSNIGASVTNWMKANI